MPPRQRQQVQMGRMRGQPSPAQLLQQQAAQVQAQQQAQAQAQAQAQQAQGPPFALFTERGFDEVGRVVVDRRSLADHEAVAKELGWWMVIYPQYLDQALTHAQGRRVAKDDALERPTAMEMAIACMRLGLADVAVEGKAFPRLPAFTTGQYGGRLRVKVFSEPSPKNPPRTLGGGAAAAAAEAKAKAEAAAAGEDEDDLPPRACISPEISTKKGLLKAISKQVTEMRAATAAKRAEIDPEAAARAAAEDEDRKRQLLAGTARNSAASAPTAAGAAAAAAGAAGGADPKAAAAAPKAGASPKAAGRPKPSPKKVGKSKGKGKGGKGRRR